MRILLIKTSSLGDVIHNLPVLSDLARAFPDAVIDWCVEEAFADIPRLHPALHRAIPVAVRRWRKGLTRGAVWREIGDFRQTLGAENYDFVLDTQGLVKSALIAKAAPGVRLGYNAGAAREPLAARFYDQTFAIPRNLHAVTRNRWLAAAAFGLPADFVETTPLDYGIVPPSLELPWLGAAPRHAVLLSATSRDDKLWDEANWVALGRTLAERGITPVFPGGSAPERERAARLAAAVPGALAAPPLTLTDAAALLGHAALSVGVDTGLVHLSAALGTPTLAVYTATDPALTGALAPAARGFVRNLGGKGAAPTAEQVLAIAEMALRSAAPPSKQKPREAPRDASLRAVGDERAALLADTVPSADVDATSAN
ncbi:lipopolysaccharide heptosyltransferase I [Rhodocyclus tenuis]|uniref:Lipopolysaccharide heptosyltransferase 1 n=1 Tax=Rhodocyclus tenuis TaxID=1066 RepID=A0A840G320_RHOTE|nr:lipopolysaccharide heptosyltransferase I [Rhodocyclus tenuis]MBB4246325.1 heptosyltransferase-1 [Rhodocyclus tenuis]